MVMLALQRFGIAAFAFLLALLWQGIGIASGFECLAVFSAVYVVASAAQKRRAVRARKVERRRPRRSRTVDDVEETKDVTEWPHLQTNW
jgi:membrane protein implicated in regulation of membrane protease activity